MVNLMPFLGGNINKHPNDNAEGLLKESYNFVFAGNCGYDVEKVLVPTLFRIPCAME